MKCIFLLQNSPLVRSGEDVDEDEVRERKRQRLEEDIIKVEEGFIEEKEDYNDRKLTKRVSLFEIICPMY